MDRSSGWMQAVVFNSLLILMPVIGAQTLSLAFSGSTFAESPGIEAIDQTRRNMDDAFSSFAPRNAADKYKFWHDIVERELNEMDVAAARGFLLAAPQMLDRESVRELEADSSGIRLDRADDRLAAAALRKLPLDVGLKFEDAQISAGIVNTSITVAAPAAETENVAAPEPDGGPSGTEITAAGNRPASDSSFLLLGTFADLANNSERWLANDRVDPITLKITAIGLIEAETADGLSDANVRAASILKSARRARRMTPQFTSYIKEKIDDALPDDKLKPALEEAFSSLATTNVRVDRVRNAFMESVNLRGLERLESDLAQIDRIGSLTSPSAAITMIEHVQDGSDLRRVRLLTEAGGDRAVALVKQAGPGALKIADTGVKWTRQLAIQVMGLTASGLALLFVTLSTFRRNIRFQKKVEPAGI